MNLLSSSVWEDIGSHEKPQEAINPYRHFKGPPIHDRESPEVIEARRLKNISVLEDLKSMAELFEQDGACVHMKIKGKAFDFYPSSGTWFSHAKNVYGTGIEKISVLISEKLGSL